MSGLQKQTKECLGKEKNFDMFLLQLLKKVVLSNQVSA